LKKTANFSMRRKQILNIRNQRRIIPAGFTDKTYALGWRALERGFKYRANALPPTSLKAHRHQRSLRI
jgi:hypothetical protein